MGQKCGDKRRVLEDEENARLDHQRRGEIRSLNRHYYKLENDPCGRQAKAVEFKGNVRNIRNLKEEKRELMLLLHLVSTDEENRSEYWSSSESVKEMLSIYNSQAALVQDCEESLVEIGHYVEHIVRMINKSRARILASSSFQVNPEKTNKRIEALENKLHFMMTRMNTRMTWCATMRAEILDWLREREAYRQEFISIRRKISWVKHQLNAVVAKANSCYDKYDEARNQQKNILRRNAAECSLFVNELKDNIRFLREDRYNRNFVELKQKMRENIEFDGDRFHRIINNRLKNWNRVLLNYQRIFKETASEAGSSDVDRIKECYEDIEDQNRTTFLTLNLLTSCIQALESETDTIRGQICARHKQLEEHIREHRGRVEGYETEHSNLRNTLGHWEQQWDNSCQSMNDLVLDLDSLLTSAGCKDSGVLKFLGIHDNSECTPQNTRIFLKGLEYRVLGCLKRKEKLLSLARRTGFTTSVISNFLKGTPADKPVSMGGPFKPTIIIPPGLDKEDAEEDEKLYSKYPMKYSEFKQICRELVNHSTALIKAIAQGHGSLSVGVEDDELGDAFDD